MSRSAKQSDGSLKSLRAASKALSRVDIEPLLLILSILKFLDCSIDEYEWPYEQRPLQLPLDVMLALNLFAFGVLQTLNDREGVQKPVIFLWAMGGLE